MRDYENEIKDLVAGDIEEIKVTKEELMDFREVWLVSDNKDKIVGRAEFGGETSYYYKED